MAGDWIKVSNDLWDKPEIIEIAELTGCDVDAVVGKVQRVWVWFDRQTEDGRARLTLAFLNRLVGCPQFAEAMCHVGWLVVDGRHLTIPNFDRHNGQSAKARALTGRRVQRLRNGAARTTALPEKRRVREEERDPRRSFPQLAAASRAAVCAPDPAPECDSVPSSEAPLSEPPLDSLTPPLEEVEREISSRERDEGRERDEAGARVARSGSIAAAIPLPATLRFPLPARCREAARDFDAAMCADAARRGDLALVGAAALGGNASPASHAACAEAEPCAECAAGARCRDAPPLPFESPPGLDADPPSHHRANPRTNPPSQLLTHAPSHPPADPPTHPHAQPPSGLPAPPTRQQQIDAVYAAYPRKVGAAKAKAEIARALRKVPFERLLAAVQEFARSRVGEDPKWTPYPERWFSKERWNDDPREWQHAAANRHATANPHAARLGPGQIYDPDAQAKDSSVGRL